jgi:signal transduction histidine kinase
MIMDSWGLYLTIWLLAALAHLALPIVLFRRWPSDENTRRLTTFYGGLAAAWGASGALTALTEQAPTVAESAGLVFSSLAPAVAGLALILEHAFVGEKDGRLWGTLGSGWGVLVFGVGLYTRRSGNVPWAVGLMAACGWAALWAVQSTIWSRQYAQMAWAFQRNRALYWLWVSILLVVGQALALFTPALSWLAGFVGLLLHLGGLAIVTIAVTHRDLPNVRAALRKSFSSAVSILLMAALLLVSLLILSPYVQPLQPIAVVLVGVLSMGLVLIYEPLQELVARLAEQLVPRSGRDLDEKLRAYSLAIANIIDLEQLAAVVAGTVSDVLDVERAALIVAMEKDGEVRLQPLRGIGDIPQREISLDILNPVIEHMQGQQRLLFQHNLAQDTAFRNLVPQVRAWLQQLGMEVYVPIFAKSIFLGILAAGPPRSSEPFGAREQTFLSALANQTAVALQNARMFEDMRELNLEITQLNQDLRQTMERVERLDRAKTDFLTITSHELRTPLTHVKGYADLLTELCAAKAVTTEQIEEITRSICRAANRLETIVEALLNMSQLEADHLDMFLSPTTLEAVLRMALRPWMKPIQLRKLHLTVQNVEDIPPIVVDLQKLSQAFGNLISNAIKYTPDGGTIFVRARRMNDALYEVVVTDNGVGIDPADQELIFDKFFRVGEPDLYSSGESSFMGGGPGLGLSIARAIIEAHGGRIWVTSEGHDKVHCPGSAFHVVLPLEAISPVAAPATSEEKVMPFTVMPKDL